MTYDVVVHNIKNIPVGYSIVDIPFEQWTNINNENIKANHVVIRVNVGAGFTQESARIFVAHVIETLIEAERAKTNILANTFLRTRHPKT